MSAARRLHDGIDGQGKWLAQVLRGWMAYYAVPMSGSAISASRTIWARQTCFWAALRSAIRARRRRRTVDETVREIPWRMLQTRMRQRAEEIPIGVQMLDFIH